MNVLLFKFVFLSLVPSVDNATLVYSKYLGKLNKTFSGKTCQTWTSTIPHYHDLHGNLFKVRNLDQHKCLK